MPAISPSQAGRLARLVYVRSYMDTNIWRIETSALGAPASSARAVAISSTRRDEIAQFSLDRRHRFVDCRNRLLDEHPRLIQVHAAAPGDDRVRVERRRALCSNCATARIATRRPRLTCDGFDQMRSRGRESTIVGR